VRNQSSLMRRINQATGASSFEATRIADIGDAWVRKAYELEGVLAEIEAFFARARAAGIRVLACDGDHAISLAILRGLKPEKPLGMIHIDAHCDTGDNYLGLSVHHGAPFKKAVNEGLLDPKSVVQIGIRGSLYLADMWKFSFDRGMRVMMIEEVEERGWRVCIEEARGIVGDGPVYVSFDIDSLDPAFAPGAARLAGLDIVRADMVEVSPPFDQGGITALNGTRPRAMRDTRYKWAYIFGAACPARATAAGLVMPFADTQAMNAISRRSPAPSRSPRRRRATGKRSGPPTGRASRAKKEQVDRRRAGASG
jgi:guanidinopropionase